jgi:hypothetical protein
MASCKAWSQTSSSWRKLQVAPCSGCLHSRPQGLPALAPAAAALESVKGLEGSHSLGLGQEGQGRLQWGPMAAPPQLVQWLMLRRLTYHSSSSSRAVVWSRNHSKESWWGQGLQEQHSNQEHQPPPHPLPPCAQDGASLVAGQAVVCG